MNAECFFWGGNRRHARKGDCLGLDTLNVKNWVDHMVDQNWTNIRIDNIEIKSYYIMISVTSGASTRKGVEVRVFSWAPFSKLPIGNLL